MGAEEQKAHGFMGLTYHLPRDFWYATYHLCGVFWYVCGYGEQNGKVG